MYHLFTFMCCMMFVGLTESMTAKCKYGEYQHAGNTCCFCPRGSRVVSDCNITHDRKCELCKPGSYADHPNNDYKCQPCKICDPNVNMEEEEKCSLYSNTICKCQKNHYCEKPDQCRTCIACHKCETEVLTECTETNNTVCKDAQSNRTRIPEKNVDLTPYLPEIADHLSWKMMKRVAQRSGMNTVSIDNHEYNHPHDAKERTNGLLQQWHQEQGLYEAYPALIKSLCDIKERTAADKIKKIIEKSQAEAQP